MLRLSNEQKSSSPYHSQHAIRYIAALYGLNESPTGR